MAYRKKHVTPAILSRQRDPSTSYAIRHIYTRNCNNQTAVEADQNTKTAPMASLTKLKLKKGTGSSIQSTFHSKRM
jgi:hypothetical protein